MKTFEELYDKDGRYITDPSYTEIIKLHEMLDEGNIPHLLIKNTDGWQVIYPSEKNRIADAIENFGSYGHAENLLELMGLLTPEEEQRDSVAGYLKAEEVYKRFAEDWGRCGA